MYGVCSVIDSSTLVFGEVNCMAPNDIRQYLYNLRARPELSADIRQFRSNTLVGKMDIVWQTNLGERGRLQTSPLQRIVSHTCCPFKCIPVMFALCGTPWPYSLPTNGWLYAVIHLRSSGNENYFSTYHKWYADLPDTFHSCWFNILVNIVHETRLQEAFSCCLCWQAPGSGDIKVSVLAVPEAVAVGSTIDVDFQVTNCSLVSTIVPRLFNI